MLFGSAQLSYERALNENSAVELSLAYTSLKATFSGLTTEESISGVWVEFKYKLYFSSSNDAPRGWYAGPLANYNSITGKSGDSKGTISAYGGGTVAGYQWVFGDGDTGFALDFNLGAQYLSVSTDGDICGTNIDGVLPRLGLSIGYAF